MSPWNPEAYLKYQDERTQPSRDLLARIELEAPAQAVDIGCGPGNSTRVLRERWPAASLLGLDSSPAMIDHARQTDSLTTWRLVDVTAWEPEHAFDLVFSSATLQWIPGHTDLLPKLFGWVAPQGALAVQVPANNDSYLYLAVQAVAHREEWRQLTAGCDALQTYLPPSFYYDLLAPLAARLTLWQTTYYHSLPNHQGLIDWYASTGLKPYLERLPRDVERRAFQAQILEICRDQYPLQSDRRVLFPFRRLFFVAYK